MRWVLSLSATTRVARTAASCSAAFCSRPAMRTCWLTVVFISRRSILSSTTECSFANQDESSEMSRPWYSRRQPEVRVRVRVRVRTRVLASVVRVRERVRLEAHLRVGVAVALPQQLPLCG